MSIYIVVQFKGYAEYYRGNRSDADVDILGAFSSRISEPITLKTSSSYRGRKSNLVGRMEMWCLPAEDIWHWTPIDIFKLSLTLEMPTLLCEYCIDVPRKGRCAHCERDYCQHYHGEECGFCVATYCVFCDGNVKPCSRCQKINICSKCVDDCDFCEANWLCSDCLELKNFRWTCLECYEVQRESRDNLPDRVTC